MSLRNLKKKGKLRILYNSQIKYEYKKHCREAYSDLQ